MKTQWVTKSLFWIAFCSFLAVSIPHVAWLYRAFEPDELVWWIIAYVVAIGIDVLVCWVSYVLSTGNGLDKALFGVFIALLLTWSYYANYLYAMAHTPWRSINVWTIPLVFGLTTGSVTPYIIAAAPVFAIGYTFMLGKIGHAKVETLEEKAARLENEKALKQRIADASQGRYTGKIKGFISGASDVIKHGRNAVKDMAQNGQDNATIAGDLGEQKADDGMQQNTQHGAGKIVSINRPDTATLMEHNTQLEAGKTEDEHVKMGGSSGAGSGRTVTIKEAAERLGLSVNYVRDLRDNGTLKRSPRNKNLLLKNAVEAYYNRRQNMPINGSKNERHTDKMEALNLPQDTDINAS